MSDTYATLARPHTAEPVSTSRFVHAENVGITFATKRGPFIAGMAISLADPGFLLHQDTGDPFNVADKPECSPEFTPWNVHFGDPATGEQGGEFFGWAVGH